MRVLIVANGASTYCSMTPMLLLLMVCVSCSWVSTIALQVYRTEIVAHKPDELLGVLQLDFVNSMDTLHVRGLAKDYYLFTFGPEDYPVTHLELGECIQCVLTLNESTNDREVVACAKISLKLQRRWRLEGMASLCSLLVMHVGKLMSLLGVLVRNGYDLSPGFLVDFFLQWAI